MSEAVNTVTRILIEGREYSIDAANLTWGEMELLEKETGVPIGRLEMESATTMLVLAWLARRRREPTCSMDDMRRLPMQSIEVVEEPDPSPAAVDSEISTDGTIGNPGWETVSDSSLGTSTN